VTAGDLLFWALALGISLMVALLVLVMLGMFAIAAWMLWGVMRDLARERDEGKRR
jgi:Tfp pilus assembly protein PilX